ncbi:MAG: methionine--tRNA ligase, partial [Candidatus Marinimicrobia bacterium]|nr:methionine--tRNA ligase [Candidatus Neomarinimicrobiota bacterium]
MQNFYLTTPIYYVNDQPHLGHAYTTILADVLARYHRAIGDEVFFLTGTDEHGLKVQQAAEARGTSEQEHTDEYVKRFQNLWDRLYISNNDFIRTTEPRHKQVVQHLLQLLYDKGELYLDSYEGLYSVSEERFVTEKEAESGNFKQIERIHEKNWFFKMSAYQERLIDHINANPKFIQPESRRNEVLGFLRQPLKDLCISRPKSRLKWGVEIPFDTDYVTYVWFDALTNYISAIGYSKDDELFNQWWPVNYHLIGKDILTNHAVYWPTMLMAAGIELPQTIYAHGWWMMGKDKMSKSSGNAIQPLDLIEHVGIDPVRYYLMREMVLGSDAVFTPEHFMRRYNADLANDLGNLTNRISKFIWRHFDERVPPPQPPDDATAQESLKQFAAEVVKRVPQQIHAMKLHEAIESAMELVRKVNVYLEICQPWKQIKEDPAQAGNTMYQAAEGLRIAAQLLAPVMPSRTDNIRAMIGGAGVDISFLEWGGILPGTRILEPESPFPRLNELQIAPVKAGKRRVPRKATAKSLENAALWYLTRFATSAANLERVLARRVQRSARHHGTDREEGLANIARLIARYRRSGLLDDRAYAIAKAGTL